MSKEHAYDAGYRDGSVHYEPEHCPACKNVADLQEALDENASLRERIHELEMEGSDYFYRTAYAEDANRTLEVGNAKLQAENAKLRELVRYMWREGAFEPGACYVDTERLEERTRELGIEVDE